MLDTYNKLLTKSEKVCSIITRKRSSYTGITKNGKTKTAHAFPYVGWYINSPIGIIYKKPLQLKQTYFMLMMQLQ